MKTLNISRMPIACLMGWKNMICHRFFLPYEMIAVSLRKSPIHYTSLLWKKLKLFFLYIYRILLQIKFVCPIRHFMGILEMDFGRIFEAIFFYVAFTSSTCASGFQVVCILYNTLFNVSKYVTKRTLNISLFHGCNFFCPE